MYIDAYALDSKLGVKKNGRVLALITVHNTNPAVDLPWMQLRSLLAAGDGDDRTQEIFHKCPHALDTPVEKAGDNAYNRALQ
jgi:hypothetical protein